MTTFHKQCAFLFMATFVVVGVELWILQPWPAGEQKTTPSVADQRLLVKVHQCAYMVIVDEDKSWFSQALGWVGL